MDLILKAKEFATQAHEGQKRKYNDQSYIIHPERVATRISKLSYATSELIAAAWLHDVLEDTATTEQELRTEFGDEVTDLVIGMTNVKCPGLNREEQKQLDRDRLAAQSYLVKALKLADRIDNLADSVMYMSVLVVDGNLKFLSAYLVESLLLYHEALEDADSDLEQEYRNLIFAYLRQYFLYCGNIVLEIPKTKNNENLEAGKR